MTRITFILIIICIFCENIFAQEPQPPVPQPAPPQQDQPPAQPVSQPQPPPVVLPAIPPAPQPVVSKGAPDDPKYSDPNYDRIASHSSAETLPKGNFTFNDYQLGVLQLSYGATDTMQLSVLTGVPVFQASLMPSLKYQFITEKKYRMAFLVFGGFMRSFLPEGDDFTIFGGGAGIINDINLDSSGHNILVIGLAGGVVSIMLDEGDCFNDGDECKDKNRLYYGYRGNVDSIFRIGEKTKLFCSLEINHVIREEEKEDDSVGSFGIIYGIRLFGDHFATDLGLIRPLFVFHDGQIDDVEEVMKYMPIGYPFLSFTYKW